MTDGKQEVVKREEKKKREIEQPAPFSLTLKTKLIKCDSCQVPDNWGQLEEK